MVHTVYFQFGVLHSKPYDPKNLLSFRIIFGFTDAIGMDILHGTIYFKIMINIAFASMKTAFVL